MISFGINYQWLMGISDIQHAQALSVERNDLLPVSTHLVDGDPRESPGWDGTAIAVTGAAAARAQTAHQPYILRVDHGDARGRLCKGDLILISQSPSQLAKIVVARWRRKLVLAWRADTNRLERVSDGRVIPDSWSHRRPLRLELCGRLCAEWFMVGWFDMVHPIGKFDIADSAVSAVGPVMRSSLIVADGDALQRIAVAAERIAAHLTEMRTTPCCAAGRCLTLDPGRTIMRREGGAERCRSPKQRDPTRRRTLPRN